MLDNTQVNEKETSAMKHLIVYSHPNPKSFNHAVYETYVEALKKKGHEVRVRDLYAIDFDPVLKGSDFEAMQKGQLPKDIIDEQQNIQWAEIVTFIFPIWWTGLPARVKGYIDRVFLHGFAYAVDENGVKGLLSDKKVFVFNTTGTPQSIYDGNGMFNSMSQTIDMGIFKFCAMEVVGHKFFAGVPGATNEARAEMLAEVRRIAVEVG
jgi:NAD(P)H dehydrogenase (quinone)